MRFLRRRVEKLEDEVEAHEKVHVADKAADKVAREVFEQYSTNVEKRLTILKAKLEVITGEKRDGDS